MVRNKKKKEREGKEKKKKPKQENYSSRFFFFLSRKIARIVRGCKLCLRTVFRCFARNRDIGVILWEKDLVRFDTKTRVRYKHCSCNADTLFHLG